MNETIVDLSSDKMEYENHKKRMVKTSNKVNSDFHLYNVLQYGDIVDVLGDGNYGYYAIKAMLVMLGKIEVGVSVSFIRKSMHDYVENNSNTVMNNISISIRNNNMRDSRVKRYLQDHMKRLHSDKIKF